MATKLIKLNDGIFVEIEVPGDQVEPISGGAAKKVKAVVDDIQPILSRICKPIKAVWQELNKEMYIEQAEVELGLGFEIEGNLYVTKAKGNANLTVKLILNPQKEPVIQKKDQEE